MVCIVASRLIVGKNNNQYKLGSILFVRLGSHRDTTCLKSACENCLSLLDVYLEEHCVPDLTGMTVYLTLLVKTYSSKLLQCYRTC